MEKCTRAFTLAMRDPHAANTCADLYSNRAVALQYNEEFAAAIESLQAAQRFCFTFTFARVVYIIHIFYAEFICLCILFLKIGSIVVGTKAEDGGARAIPFARRRKSPHEWKAQEEASR